MIGLLCFVLAVLASPFKSTLRLEAENAVLQHQLNVLRRRPHGAVRLTNNDRWFFIRVIAVELDASRVGTLRSGGVIMHVNKVHAVTTIGRVAKDLGEDEDWLSDVANGVDPEDGLIWVHGIADHGIVAFTDHGIDTLIELIRMHKANPQLLKR